MADQDRVTHSIKPGHLIVGGILLALLSVPVALVTNFNVAIFVWGIGSVMGALGKFMQQRGTMA